MEDMHIVSNQEIEELEFVDARQSTKHGQFIARATQKKMLSGNVIDVESETWANPDPLAISQVTPGKHPVTALINRRRGNANTVRIRICSIRWVCAHIQGKDTDSVSFDDAMKYPWHLVDSEMAADYYKMLSAHYPHKLSAYSRITLLRAIVDNCWRAKLISTTRRDEIFDELPANTMGQSKGVKVRLTELQLVSLMEACATGDEKEAAWISAMVALFTTTGLRVSELVAIDLADWDRTNKTIRLRMTKNGRDHTIPVVDGVIDYLEHWLTFRGCEAGPLFTKTRGPVLRRVGTYTVRQRLDERAAEAGIARLKPHDFRRTVASQLLRKHDPALVSRLLNHTSIAATLVYDMVTEDEQRNAVAGLSLPCFAPLKEGK